MSMPKRNIVGNGARNRAAIYARPGTTAIELVEAPIPEPGPNEVLIRLVYSGVCHTDAAICMNKFPGLPFPIRRGQIGGHEGIGEIIRLGSGVVKPGLGDIVGVQVIADVCLTCDMCIEGSESLCRNAKISGYYTPGTFQQYRVAPAKYVVPIPDGLDLAAAAPLMCGGVTVYAALKTAELRFGDWVVVSGAGGGLGHLAVQYAKAMGGKVIGIDVGEKKEFCQSVGADKFLDFTHFESDESLAATIKALTGKRGARVALMCTSSPKAYSQAIHWLDQRGTVACVGMPPDKTSINNIAMIVTKELRITGTKAGNRVDMRECLEIAAQGRVKPHFTLCPLSDLGEVFKQLELGTIEGRIVLDLREESLSHL